jgi:serine/threonine-protein kinase RsbT
VLRVATENDVTRARSIARKMCEGAGAGALALQKCATAVSELARNIIAYTSGGEVELSVRDGSPRMLRVIATDRGQGIADIGLVLSGKYKSRTGLGRGLLGVKRLAEDFSVDTSAAGTRVEALLSLGVGFGSPPRPVTSGDGTP